MKSTKRSVASDKSSEGFTEEERAAMKERAQELKASGRRGAKAEEDGESDLLAKIAAMAEPDRSLATRVHEIVKAAAPGLEPKTWYGMPAYARNGKVVCFFQNAGKFKARYSTLGFSDEAALDDGTMWPSAYALTKLTAEAEARIAALVKKAAGLTE